MKQLFWFTTTFGGPILITQFSSRIRFSKDWKHFMSARQHLCSTTTVSMTGGRNLSSNSDGTEAELILGGPALYLCPCQF